MKTLLIFLILVFAVSSCNKSDSSNHEKKSAETSDTEIKKRELDLSERELPLKERELELQKTESNIDENEIKGDFPEASARVLTDEDLRNKIPGN